MTPLEEAARAQRAASEAIQQLPAGVGEVVTRSDFDLGDVERFIGALERYATNCDDLSAAVGHIAPEPPPAPPGPPPMLCASRTASGHLCSKPYDHDGRHEAWVIRSIMNGDDPDWVPSDAGTGRMVASWAQ
jgi:hypothetical protein